MAHPGIFAQSAVFGATPTAFGLNHEAIQAAVYKVVFPLTLLSSVFLLTQSMPGWLQAFADHQPVTAITNALRCLTLGDSALRSETRLPTRNSRRSDHPTAAVHRVNRTGSATAPNQTRSR